MTAKIIQFKKSDQVPVKVICSFCNKTVSPKVQILTSGDNKHVACPSCLLKCSKLIKEDDEECQ